MYSPNRLPACCIHRLAVRTSLRLHGYYSVPDISSLFTGQYMHPSLRNASHPTNTTTVSEKLYHDQQMISQNTQCHQTDHCSVFFLCAGDQHCSYCSSHSHPGCSRHSPGCSRLAPLCGEKEETD